MGRVGVAGVGRLGRRPARKVTCRRRALHPFAHPVAVSLSPPPRALVAVLFLGTLVAALDIALVGPTLRAIEQAFGVTARLSGWVLSAFVLANLLSLPFTTWLGDARGRRAVFLGCLALFSVGTLVVVTAPTFAVLLGGRVVQGIGASGLFPMASAVVGDAFPPQRRGRVLGLLGAVFGVAFLVGPILAGVLVAYGWRLVLLVPFPLALAVFVAAIRVLPRQQARQPGRLDVRGALLLGCGLIPLALAANQVETSARGGGLFTPTALGLLLLALVALALFVHAERRAASPLLRPDLLRRRQVKIAALFCLGAGLSEATIVFLPPFSQAAFGVSRSEAAYMLLPLVLAITAGAPGAGRLLDRVGSRVVLRGAALLLTAGLGVLAALPPTLATYYAGTVLMGIGLSGMLGSALSYILLNEAAAGERSVAQGFVTLFLSVGQIVGGALIGAVVASSAGQTPGFQYAFWAVTAFAAALIAASFALKRQADEHAAHS